MSRVRVALTHWFPLLLHSAAWMREIPHENPKFGKWLHHGLFIPTDSGIGSKFREGGPTDVDRERLQMFIDTMNGLLKQGVGDVEGARFTSADFTFETIPELALSGPLFDDKEMDVSTDNSSVSPAPCLIRAAVFGRRNCCPRGGSF